LKATHLSLVRGLPFASRWGIWAPSNHTVALFISFRTPSSLTSGRGAGVLLLLPRSRALS